MGRGGWGAPGVVDRVLESTGGHLLETLRLTAHLPTRNAAARVPQTVWISIRVFSKSENRSCKLKCDFPEDLLEIS